MMNKTLPAFMELGLVEVISKFKWGKSSERGVQSAHCSAGKIGEGKAHLVRWCWSMASLVLVGDSSLPPQVCYWC